MAVDVSKIPNNSKFDPVREAILKLQKDVQEGVSGVATVNSSDGNIIITNSGNITVSTVGETITIGINDSSYLTEELNDLTAAVTWANVPDANITQSSVTQHQAALSITESQISDLGSYIELSDLSITTSATPSGGGALSYDDTTGVFTFTPADAGTGLTLQQVTANGNTTTYGISTGNISVQPAGTGNGVVAISANSVGDAALTLTPGSTAGNGVIRTTIERAISFRPFNTEKVVIASDGNMNVYEKLAVGKTTAASTYHLEVDGTALANNFITSMTASGTTYTGTFSQYYNALQIRTATGGTISLGGSGPLSVQNNVAIKDGDLDVNGDVTADFFIGDGSQLTNLPISSDADTLDGYHLSGTSSVSDKIFNNKGLVHSTFTDFNTVMNAGANYLQGGTNSPTGTENHQWYGFMLGLGSDYNTTTGNANGYASQLYWNRQSQGANPYLWARDLEAGTWGSWRKMSAGQADNADTLNGVAGSSFLRSDADDTATGKITINNNSNSINDPTLTITSSQGGGSFGRLMFSGTSTVAGVINRGVSGSHLYFDEDATTGDYIFRSSGRAYYYGNLTVGSTNDTEGKLVVRGDANSGMVSFFKNLNTGTTSYAEVIVRSVDSSNDLRLGTSKSYTDTEWQGGWVFAPRKLLLKSNNDVNIFAGGTGNNSIVGTFTSTGLGIGTTTPSKKLHVYSSGNEVAFFQGTSGGAWIDIQSSTSNLWSIGAINSDAMGIYNRSNSSYPLWITNGGNVGIAQTSPSARLQVQHNGDNGSGGDSEYAILANASSGQATIGAIHTAGGYANLNLGSTSSGTTEFWHLSYRQFSSKELEYFFYNGTSFDSKFEFLTDSTFKAGKVVLSGSPAIELTGSGTGTYNKTVIYNDQTYGLLVEATKATNSGSAAKKPITLTWRGGFNSNGGLNLTGDTKLVTTDTGLGIDTTSPNHKLTIDEGTGTSYVLSARNTNDNLQIKLGTTTGGYANIQASTVSGNAAYNMSLQADGGNVGIGTTTPSQKLDVNGYARSTSGFVGAGGLSLFGDNSSTQRVFITTGGSVGIGTTSPTNKLHVKSGDNEGIFMEGTGGGHWFNFKSGTSNLWSMGAQSGLMGWYNRTDFSYKMVITDGGNVGIGTTSDSVGGQPSGTSGRLNIYTSVGSSSWAQQIRHDSSTGNGLFVRAGGNSNYYTAYFTGYDENNVHFVVRGDGNVGIGTTSPSAKLDVNGIIKAQGNQVNPQEYGVSMVGNFGQWQAHGTYTDLNTVPAYWGWNYVQGNTNAPNSNSNQWYRGRFSLGDQYGLGTSSGDYWMEIAVPRYNYAGGDAGQMFVRACEDGVEGSWYQVGRKIIGDFTATGDVVAYGSSDRRLKDNITPIPNALDKVNAIGGYEFDWNDNQETYEGHDVGVIAQEVEEVMPEVVTTREDGYKAVKYEKLVPLLIESIKELKQEIDELKAKLDA